MTINLIAFDGDGIGPEIMTSTLEVINHLNTKLSLDVNIEKELIGIKSLKALGTTLPKKALLKSKEADGIILGPVDHNNYPIKSEGGVNPSGVLRIELDLFANIRPAKNYNNIQSLSKKMDLIIVRENTEGFYADRNMVDGNGEFSPVEGVGLAFRKITKKASLRIAEEAFNIAYKISLSRDKKIKVHAIHKANVMRLTDGIFLDACRQVSSKYSDIHYEEMLVDACAAHIVRDPSQFDIIVTTNMFGDILSDLATELSGSLGLAGSLNSGENQAMAQAQHGSANDIAEKNIANPISLILSASMLLNWLGEKRKLENFILASSLINNSVIKLLANDKNLTKDLGGTASTQETTKKLISILNHFI
ncbi:isocitrate/isopropylmalate family dehydrogenase [Alphaproteobacteria bacterium]|nr:isocitrate/isopropylmalate family dehydrogenase [Alphaproteobacteria bacterium]